MQTDHYSTWIKFHRSMGALLFMLCALMLAGCKDKTEESLDTDANGYVCMKCAARFYTVRDVFPNTCPKCKQGDIEQAMGFICSEDKQMTLGPRNRRSMPCEKCRKPATGLVIPREADLIKWGAQKKTAAEVGA